jgi:hypothetical protein
LGTLTWCCFWNSSGLAELVLIWRNEKQRNSFYRYVLFFLSVGKIKFLTFYRQMNQESFSIFSFFVSFIFHFQKMSHVIQFQKLPWPSYLKIISNLFLNCFFSFIQFYDVKPIDPRFMAVCISAVSLILICYISWNFIVFQNFPFLWSFVLLLPYIVLFFGFFFLGHCIFSNTLFSLFLILAILFILAFPFVFGLLFKFLDLRFDFRNQESATFGNNSLLYNSIFFVLILEIKKIYSRYIFYWLPNMCELWKSGKSSLYWIFYLSKFILAYFSTCHSIITIYFFWGS